MKQRIFNLIILDESGSMHSIASQTVLGVNETLQTIKIAQQVNEEQEHLVSFVTFNGEGVRMHYKCRPADLIAEFTHYDYHPISITPLYDAMGISLTQMKDMVGEEDKVLVTIITDGYENASCKYRLDDIAELVTDLREKGWVFTYIGANQDVEKVAKEMNIKHSMAFNADIEGAKAMFDKEQNARIIFYKKVSSRQYHDEDDFFSETNCDNEKNEENTARREGSFTMWWKSRLFNWLLE